MKTLGDLFVGKENNLTFIRLVAALAVIYGHTNAIVATADPDWVTRTTNYAFAGGVAVDLFFLISGFLVTASILKGGAINYIISRILRIFPALWVNLILVTFLLGTIVTTLPIRDYLTHGEVWSYFRGLALAYKGGFFLPGVFTENHNQAVNGSIWSVLIEVWLYIAILGAFLLGLMRSRAVFNSVFFIVIVASWSNYSQLIDYINNPTMYHVCLFFYIGSFLYINRMHIPASPYYLLIALFLAAITINTDRFAFAYIIVLVTFFCSVSFLKQFSWLDRFGDFSYGVYLYGWPCQQLVAWLFPGFSGLQNCAASITLALLCGALSWHLIEKRAMRLKRLILRPANSLPLSTTPIPQQQGS